MDSEHTIHSTSAQVNPASKFEEFLARNAHFAMCEARRLAAVYGLSQEDADDIRSFGNMRIWKLFLGSAKASYEFLGKEQDQGLIRINYRWGTSDVIRREQKDRLFYNALSLEEPLGSDDEQTPITLADTISKEQPTNESSKLVEALEVFQAKTQNPGYKLVVDFLLGKIEKDELASRGYDDNYIGVAKHRIKRWLEKYLR